MARTKKFLRNTKAPKDQASQKAVNVLLEDVRHDFKAFGEDLASVRRETREQTASVRREMRAGYGLLSDRMGRLELRMKRLEAETRSLRAVIGTLEQPNLITKKQYSELNTRLQKVEAALAVQRTV